MSSHSLIPLPSAPRLPTKVALRAVLADEQGNIATFLQLFPPQETAKATYGHVTPGHTFKSLHLAGENGLENIEQLVGDAIETDLRIRPNFASALLELATSVIPSGAENKLTVIYLCRLEGVHPPVLLGEHKDYVKIAWVRPEAVAAADPKIFATPVHALAYHRAAQIVLGQCEPTVLGGLTQAGLAFKRAFCRCFLPNPRAPREVTMDVN